VYTFNSLLNYLASPSFDFQRRDGYSRNALSALN